MTNQQILEKAIKKAEDNGWKPGTGTGMEIKRWRQNKTFIPSYNVIFNHDFARALWGEGLVEWRDGYEKMVNVRGEVVLMPTWKLHLQQMVISDDPIKYLGEHL